MTHLFVLSSRLIDASVIVGGWELTVRSHIVLVSHPIIPMSVLAKETVSCLMNVIATLDTGDTIVNELANEIEYPRG